jgi:hypothetical protein
MLSGSEEVLVDRGRAWDCSNPVAGGVVESGMPGRVGWSDLISNPNFGLLFYLSSWLARPGVGNMA